MSRLGVEVHGVDEVRSAFDRLRNAFDTFARVLGVTGVRFVDRMAIPTRIRTCGGTRRR